MNNTLYFLQFALSRGIGEVAIRKAINIIKSDNTISWYDIIKDKSVLNLKNEMYDCINLTEDNAKLLEEKLYYNNINILLESDANYPDILRLSLGRECPPVLFANGNISLLNRNGVGFCGSRNVSDKGKKITYSCAKQLVEHNINIISGYAAGTDLTAHEAALENNGSTIFVLSEGILRKTIKSSIKEYINNNNHLFISQFMPEITWNAPNAMRRNKVIVGLSLAMILIESGLEGGTFEAGKETLKLNHKLFVLDYEIQPKTAEANRYFIANGGIPVRGYRATHTPKLDKIFSVVDNHVVQKKSITEELNLV